MQRHHSKKQTQKYNENSLDDIFKHFKRNNLKSQRYDRLNSPDPYGPYRQHTQQTLQRSRTLSGNKSRKTNKTTRQKVERILSGALSKQKLNVLNRDKSGNIKRQKQKSSHSKIMSISQSSFNIPNPADLISQFSNRIKYAQKYLQGKSKMGLLICKKFLQMLNQIVENMVLNLQQNMNELQKSISQRLTKQIAQKSSKKVQKLQKKIIKLETQTIKLLQKQHYNNTLIYHLRLQSFDIDKQFGKIFYNSDNFGGSGYQQIQQFPQSQSEQSQQNFQFVKRQKIQRNQYNKDDFHIMHRQRVST